MASWCVIRGTAMGWSSAILRLWKSSTDMHPASPALTPERPVVTLARYYDPSTGQFLTCEISREWQQDFSPNGTGSRAQYP
jgi:hypothetical protein